MTSNPSKRLHDFWSQLGKLRWRRRLANQWRASGFPPPAPPQVKEALLLRYNVPGSVWIETGTWMGDTTEFLSTFAQHVWSIEPGPDLVDRARKRFTDKPNVSIVEGLSEDHLETILASTEGDVCLWLDGHFSSGDTFQGPVDTPILHELEVVGQSLDRLGTVVVLVDDVRCFDPKKPQYATYPSRSTLVAWADSHDLEWMIEHDIFIARKRTSWEGVPWSAMS